MDINKITNIGRPLNLNYLTNKLIAIIALLTFAAIVLASAIHGDTNHVSLITGIRTGLLIFLLWAISRELDPDNNWSAFVTVFLALAVIIFSEIPPLLSFVWLVILLRTINHSTGMPAGIMDSLLVAVVGIILAYHTSFIYGILTAAGLILDSRLKDPAKHHLAAGIILLVTSIVILIEKNAVVFTYPLENMLIFVFGTALFLPVIMGPTKLESVGDRTGKTLEAARFKLARIMTIVLFFAMAIMPGEINAQLVTFMFCIFAGIGIYRIVLNTLPHTFKH
ncbi:hypothetical protein [Methanolobus sp. ZRKC5]|uniref:hypothetical protein n=1 Tax=unclassified Methanolobus TaxID=2629569 RepID=UPI00313DE9E5